MVSLLAELGTRFALGRQLGRGSYGEVLEVIDRRSGAHFALKHLEVPGDGERERREIAASLRLVHPHVVRCYEGGLRGQEAYLLMELAEGTLATRIHHADQRRENFRALCEVAEALVALHREGLIHRDLKPANVLFVDGRAKLADLGLTRDVSLETVTAEGMILGTPGYLAPEQALGKRATPAVDAYALGILFYETMVGELPYSARSTMELLQQVARAQQHRLPCSDEALAPRTRRHIEKLLAPDPAARPGDLEAWLRELTELPGPAEADGPAPSSRATVQLARAELGSGRRSLPRTDRRRGSQDRRWRSAAAALVLGAGVASFLLSKAPPASPAASASEARSRLPFGAEDIQRIRDQLTDLQAKVVLADGRLLDPQDASGEKAVPFPDADPVQWGNLARWIPEVDRFWSWALAGGDPRDIPDDVRGEMLRTDEYLDSLRMPPLFAPVLAAVPAPPSDAYALFMGPVHAGEAPPGPSRIHALAELFPQLVDQSMHAGKALLIESRAPVPDGAEVGFLRRWRAFQRPSNVRAQAYFETYGAHRPARLAAQPYLRPWGFRLRQAAHILRLEYGPDSPAGFALLGARIAQQCDVALQTEALTDPLVVPPDGGLSGLPPEFVAEILMLRAFVWDQIGQVEREHRDRARGRAVYREILARPAPTELAAKRLRAFSVSRLIWWLRDTDYQSRLDLLRGELPTYRGLEVHLADEVHRFLSDGTLLDPGGPEVRALLTFAEEILPVLEAAAADPEVGKRMVAIEDDLLRLRGRP